jgi:cytochrome c biogenesis protein CcmG/thiol:disulfide interchange protein DsbE
MRNNRFYSQLPPLILSLIFFFSINCAVRPPDIRKPVDQRPDTPDNSKTDDDQRDKPIDRQSEGPGTGGRTDPAWGNAPDFTLDKYGGGSLTLSDYLGKVIILDFWATWCPPCRQEIPDFVQLQNDYGSRGLVVIGVSLDRDGETAVRPYADEIGINYPVVYGFIRPEVGDSYGGIPSIPTTFFINQKGDIVEKYVGYQSRTVFEPKIKQLLGLIQEEKP